MNIDEDMCDELMGRFEAELKWAFEAGCLELRRIWKDEMGIGRL